MKLRAREAKEKVYLRQMYHSMQKYGEENNIPNICELLIQEKEKQRQGNPIEFFSKVTININFKDFGDTETISYSCFYFYFYSDSIRLIQFFRSFIEQ